MDVQNRYFTSNKKWKEEKARREAEKKNKEVQHLFKPAKVTKKLPTPEAFFQRQQKLKEEDKHAMTRFAQKKSARHNFRVRLRDLSLNRDQVVNELSLKLVGELPSGKAKEKLARTDPRHRTFAPSLARSESLDSEVEKVKNIYLNEDLEDALDDEDDHLINRSIVEDLYKQFAPHKMHEIDPLMEKYKDDMVGLFEKLAKKFKINEESDGKTRTIRGGVTRQVRGTSYSTASGAPRAYNQYEEVPVSSSESVETAAQVKTEIESLKASETPTEEKSRPPIAPVSLGGPTASHLLRQKPVVDYGKRNHTLSRKFRGKPKGPNNSSTGHFSEYTKGEETTASPQQASLRKGTRHSLKSFKSVYSMQSFQSIPGVHDSPEVEQFKTALDMEIKGKLYSGEYVTSIVEAGGRWWVNRDKPKQHPSQRKRDTLLEELRRGAVPIPQ